MRHKLLFCLIFGLFLFKPVPSFAQEYIDNFAVTLTAHKDGSMMVHENIDYNFGYKERHGIFRTIPLISKVGDLYRQISIEFTNIQRDQSPEKFELSRNSEEISVKIGRADRTLSGPHTYTIQYSVKNGIGSNYTDHDEIYWNVTGNGWDVPIDGALMVIQTDFGVPVGETICFTGKVGATDSSCTVKDMPEGRKLISATSLNPNEGLTIVSAFPVGTFPKSTLQKTKPLSFDEMKFFFLYIPLFIFLNFLLAPFLIYWYTKHKNKKRFGKPVVNFDLPISPDGHRISPAEAGTIDTTILDKDDITGTFFDLAIRKYIKIEEVKTARPLGFGKKTDHMITQLKDFKELNNFEKTLMEALFGGEKSVTLSKTELSFTDFSDLQEKNFKELIARGYYTKNPATQRAILSALGVFSLVFGHVILGIVFIVLARKLNGRTQLGDQIDWSIDGLKIFLKAGNKYQAWQAENLLFLEKMIPYAISLGYIDQFMKQLKILKPDYSPTWYHGSSNFYVAYGALTSSMNSHVTTSAPSSSSGFSGGSSGGGGGGGGGGSW